MPLCNPGDLRIRCSRRARGCSGLDVGTKTIGMALSDTTLAHRDAARHDPPHAVSRRRRSGSSPRSTRHGVGAARRSACRWRSTAATARAPRACASSPAISWRVRDLPLAFWDERLSTAAVEREMIAADLSRKRRARDSSTAPPPPTSCRGCSTASGGVRLPESSWSRTMLHRINRLGANPATRWRSPGRRQHQPGRALPSCRSAAPWAGRRRPLVGRMTSATTATCSCGLRCRARC